ncbi:VOC family protein [Streptomyces auratus]|uniref:VOC family protein n=1 Tax=Streptomyces auratus AGR0001 TaxID=1160718 RepID=J1ZRE1_9ACTN|nr:VOC family protein [Streptomyces auratus]QTZ90536.1 VOC family protein [Streptomyces auratus AGR0001]
MLTVLPIRYVADVAASRRFYEGLGLTYRADASVPVWAHLDAAAGGVGIHDAAVSKGRPPGTVELGFSTDERLDDVSAHLTAHGYEHTLVDEDFGRSIRVTDPDGVVLQIQEIDPETVRRSQSRL